MGEFQWLYVDLNSYFASVEQETRPELRRRPVAVVPMLADTTSCIAASYEAKAKGVKTGTRVADARRLCPGIQFVEARHEVYVDYHHRIVAAVESCHPVAAVASIDEVACRLLGPDQKKEVALSLAHEIKRKILEVGSQLTSSVGLAPNRFLAKVAADMQKPDGLTTLLKPDLPQALFNLALRDFPGIGPQMEKRLNARGVRTAEELCTVDEKGLRNIWGGIGGARFYGLLRGEELDIHSGKNKSLSQSHVLPPDFRNDDGVYAITQRLLHKAAARLRKMNHWTRSLHVSVRFTNAPRWEASLRALECQDTLTLTDLLRELWQEYPGGVPIQSSIVLGDLIADTDRTFSFFDDPKRTQLSHTMDAVNARFGRYSVHLGGIHTVLGSAPSRIAFTNIPDFDED